MRLRRWHGRGGGASPVAAWRRCDEDLVFSVPSHQPVGPEGRTQLRIYAVVTLA